MNEKVLQTILAFREERDWKQFHTPKNLAMSIAIEAAELMEVFQWSDGMAAERVLPEDRAQAREEIADVAIYLTLLANDLDIDLEQAMLDKVTQNARKYPAAKFRGVYKADE